MDARDEELVKALAPQNEGLRRAWERHSQLKAEVKELESRAHLSTDEEMHRRELQKEKLAEKDRIMRMLEEHRRAGEAASGS
jgi:uncharacterized protein YdcH (DUF465 family)